MCLCVMRIIFISSVVLGEKIIIFYCEEPLLVNSISCSLKSASRPGVLGRNDDVIFIVVLLFLLLSI